MRIGLVGITWDQAGNEKSKMAVSELKYSYLNFKTQDVNEIPTATPMFSGSSYLMAVMRILHDQTGTSNSKMTAAKPEIHISQLV